MKPQGVSFHHQTLIDAGEIHSLIASQKKFNGNKLKDYMPREFLSCEHENPRAFSFHNVRVIIEHHISNKDWTPWTGPHKNVSLWVELENGFAVGFNENPASWSFPVRKLKVYSDKNLLQSNKMANSITIQIAVWNNKTVEVSDKIVKIADITRFGIECFRVNLKAGGFKKWGKRGVIRRSDGTCLNCAPHYITEIKRLLKGKYDSEKTSLSVWKETRRGRVERKATDWRYIVRKSNV